MRLKIDNFAKIASADIKLEGLTIIAGNNNTGKSTVGKVLYSVFRGMSCQAERIHNERIDSIRFPLGKKLSSLELPKDQCEALLNGELNVDESLKKVLENVFPEHEDTETREQFFNVILENFQKRVRFAQSTPDEIIAAQIVQRVFHEVFHGQFRLDKTPTEIELTIQGRKNTLTFDNGLTSSNAEILLSANAYFIDSPEVLNYMNAILVKDKNAAYESILEKYVYELACRLIEDMPQPILEEIQTSQEWQEVRGKLEDVINGIFIKDDQNQYVLKEQNSANHIKAENLSMGLKGLVLIRTMLEKGILRKKDVLILDEPEIHLHTEWQIAYAEIVVLLQKMLDLRVLITSHSPDFINALRVFARAYGIEKGLNAYISENAPQSTEKNVFTHVDSQNWDILFSKFLIPLRDLKARMACLESAK